LPVFGAGDHAEGAAQGRFALKHVAGDGGGARGVALLEGGFRGGEFVFKLALLAVRGEQARADGEQRGDERGKGEPARGAHCAGSRCRPSTRHWRSRRPRSTRSTPVSTVLRRTSRR